MSSALNGASEINHDTFSNKYRPSVLVASLNRTSQFLQFSSSQVLCIYCRLYQPEGLKITLKFTCHRRNSDVLKNTCVLILPKK